MSTNSLIRNHLFILLLTIPLSAQAPADSQLSFLAGNWTWQSTWGGWGGTTQTPATEGYSMSILFEIALSAGTLSYQSFMSDTPVDSGTCELLRDTVNQYYGNPTWAVNLTGLAPAPNYGTATQLTILSDTSIIMWVAGVSDGFYYAYGRSASSVRSTNGASYPRSSASRQSITFDLAGRVIILDTRLTKSELSGSIVKRIISRRGAIIKQQ